VPHSIFALMMWNGWDAHSTSGFGSLALGVILCLSTLAAAKDCRNLTSLITAENKKDEF
jgi:hypothetical protein